MRARQSAGWTGVCAPVCRLPRLSTQRYFQRIAIGRHSARSVWLFDADSSPALIRTPTSIGATLLTATTPIMRMGTTVGFTTIMTLGMLTTATMITMGTMTTQPPTTITTTMAFTIPEPSSPIEIRMEFMKLRLCRLCGLQRGAGQDESNEGEEQSEEHEFESCLTQRVDQGG